jgi:hypothetical protein
MSTAAKFSNNVEISGNVDISGNINLDGTLTVDGSFSLYGYHIPDPNGENNKVLTISGDGYSWETVQSGSDGDEEINAAGQTFYEIITEQPRAFDISLIDDASFANTFNTIDIAWNFDDLIPKDENNQQQILNITENLNQRVLPCITHIYFDISSNESGQENTTKSDSSNFVIAVDANDNYNVDTSTTTSPTWSIGTASLNSTLTYKTLTLSNANTNALLYTYTVRIWGENQSNGTVVNKLTYSDLEFLSSGIPATPTIHSITPSGTDTAKLDISLNVPDIDIINANTIYDATGGIEIKDVDISCTETETLRSSNYDHGNSFELSQAVTSQSHAGGTEDISVNVSYSSTDFNLGSKYEIQAKCINALNATDGSNNDGYTSYSSVFQMTDFIDVPTKEDLNTSSPFDSTFTYTNKTEDGGNNQFEINQAYSNIMIYDYSRTSTQSVTFNTSSNPSQIEVSDPDADKDDSFGYGKYIDGSLNLVTLECWLNDNGTDISLHTINFHGWNNQDVSHTYYYQNSSNNNIDFFTIAGSPYSDVFSGTTRQEGFRLQVGVSSATILLEDMSYNNLMVPFDPYRDEYENSTGYSRTSNSNPSSTYKTGYTFNYRYTHNNSHSTNYSQQIESEQLYIDYFPDYSLTSSNATSDWTYTVEVKSVGYIMGIPYAKTIDLSMNRDHYNAHSEYRYHRLDGEIASFDYLYARASNDNALGGVLDGTTVTYLTLPDNVDDFDIDGTYNGGLSWTGLDYTSKITAAADDNTIIGFRTRIITFNLYVNSGWFTSDISFADDGNKNHYFDYNSLNNYSTIFDNNIYELSDISELGSNMQSVHDSLELYQDATSSTEIKDYSILYIDGLFQLDSRKNIDQYYPYPDICDSFEWNGLISSYNNNTYTNKDKRYTTSGTQDNTDGYRWLVYKVDEGSSSVEFVDAGNNSTGTAGINLSYIMNKLFGSTIETEFYNSLSNSSYDDDILVYIVGSNKSSGVHFLGRIIQDSPGFDTSNKWYSSNNITSVKSLGNMASGDACGALPGSSLQTSIRSNTSSSHSSYSNFTNNINGHSPIAIYIDSDSVGDHYFYFAIR